MEQWNNHKPLSVISGLDSSLHSVLYDVVKLTQGLCLMFGIKVVGSSKSLGSSLWWHGCTQGKLDQSGKYCSSWDVWLRLEKRTSEI